VTKIFTLGTEASNFTQGEFRHRSARLISTSSDATASFFRASISRRRSTASLAKVPIRYSLHHINFNPN
jgi:hypothetical protein